MLLWFSFICICRGLRKVSWLSELLNIQGVLMALWGAGCFRRAGQGRPQTCTLFFFFFFTRISSNCLFFKWTLQLLLMQKPHELLASGRINPCGAATPTHLPRARTSPLLSARSGAWRAHFYQWFEFLNLSLWGVVIKYVTKSFVTFIGVLFFWSLWKCEETWCYQAFLIRYSNDERGKLGNMFLRDQRVPLLLKNSFNIWFQKPDHRRKHPMVSSLVIKNYRV